MSNYKVQIFETIVYTKVLEAESATKAMFKGLNQDYWGLDDSEWHSNLIDSDVLAHKTAEDIS